jgi:hypothetical protein
MSSTRDADRRSQMVQPLTHILEHRLPDRTPGQAQKPQSLSSLDLVGFSPQSVNVAP